MKPKISIVTLAVADLDRATSFYRDGLGLPQYEPGNGDISFFTLEGTWLALYPHQALAEDIGITKGDATGYCGVTLAHNVDSREKVDAVMQQAETAGATLIKQATEVFWGGYSGYFQDPDGHLWEVAYNPFMDLT